MGSAVTAHQYCCVGARNDAAHGATVDEWLKSSGKGPNFPLPPGANPHGTAGELLKSLLAIERVVRSESVLEAAESVRSELGRIDVVLDEPGARYCLCTPESDGISSVTGCLWMALEEVRLSDAVTALASSEERKNWDSDIDVLRQSNSDDGIEEEVTYHTLRAPWPFWDRDVLQKRWRFELPSKEGFAFLMQSFDDPTICPLNPQKVRAHVHMGGYMLRPFQRRRKKEGGHPDAASDGIEITVCSSLQLGGSVPDWAQGMLCRFAASRGVAWAQKLQNYCRELQANREAKKDGEASELNEREMTGL